MFVYFLLPIAGLAATSPLWPMPKSATLGETSLTLSNQFTFTQNQVSTFMDQAIARYTTLIQPSQASGVTAISSCAISVANVYENEADTLEPGVDESYTIDITANGQCSINSETVWGALHGMETFTQLLERDSANAVLMSYAPVSIDDDTRFTHRGLLIDSARHYVPVSQIKRMIDALPMSKFNTLHWHMVDAESFPVNTPSAPDAIKGAYSSKAVFEMDDLKSLSSYASDRGVRLLMEIDIPGHAASWTKGYPQIMADCFAKYYYNINDFALNPTLEETYEVVENVLTDIISTTGAKYFHVGGDEVVYGCWANDTSIVNYMSENNIKSYDDLLEMFVLRVDKIIKGLGATPVHWEEVFKAGVDADSDVIFEVWTDQDQMSSIADGNYRIISAPSDVWYLDHSDNTWDVMYEYDPVSALTADQVSLVLGGEVCMWGEHIDENNMESIVFPRANSVAERLWSPASVNDSDAALDRFQLQRCRMIQRGFHPSAIKPGYCDKTLV